MSSKRVTIQDVAREARVSITTVSRFLNGRFESMSEETKKRIDAVIQALNYQPNALAQGLKANKSRMIAVIVVNIAYPFCVSLIRSLSNRLTPAGYNVVVCETGGEADRELEVIQSLLGQQVDGVIIQTNGHSNAELERIAKTMPVVFVDRRFAIVNAMNVFTNNYDASFEMTSHLIEQEYQVLYVSEEAGAIHTRQERLDGYAASCEQHGAVPWVSWVRRGAPDTMEDVIRHLVNRRVDRPIAVYTANALILHELYPFLRGLNWRVPSELGIATFDEPDWVTIFSPSLTCISQPVVVMGEWIANALLQQLRDGRELSTEESVQMFSSTLVLGDATRRIAESH